MDRIRGSQSQPLQMEDSPSDETGRYPVRFLQYEVREGREAGEVVVLPKAFIANCNQTCILQLGGWVDEDEVPTGARA